ncbi:MAG: hypothetical protein ABIY52_09570 [Gemmatimonadaceae bacterium]
MKPFTPLRLSLIAATLTVAACSAGMSSSSSSASSDYPTPDMSTSAPSPDPRVGLRAGTMAKWDKDTTKKVIVSPAAEAQWNMRLLSNQPPAEPFVGVTHSDLAFTGKYAIQGNYDGYQVWDITNPRAPRLHDEYVCRGSQSDVSVYGHLIFVSGEATSGRLDCGLQGISDSVSKERFRGIRIFDVTDITKPKYIASVQTCRGSHTHTVVEDPKDKENVYVYISGSAGVRPASELAGCVDLAPDVDPSGEQFRIEVIKVPLAHPEQAHVLSKPGILAGLAPAPRNTSRTAADSIDRAAQAAARGNAGGRGGRAGGPPRGPQVPRGPVQCHDITVYPAIGLGGGACGGYGLLLDISDVANPKRIGAAADSNMSFWHSATFNNDGTKVLFSDEWGGGSAPRCRSTDKYEWGADALFTLVDHKMEFKSYYKMPAAQTSFENCVAHNGSLIPIPDRDVMVQAWYQGGVSVFDWSDASHPKEIAFFDRGPIDITTAGASAGSWSVYWYNGVMVSSEIGRGLDIFELVPSAFISKNELDAAKTVHFDYLNVQGQQKIVWPSSFSYSRALLDQLERNHGQTAAKIASARAGLVAAEALQGAARRESLAALSKTLHGDAQGATDAPKAHKLAYSVGDLAKL